MDKPNFSTPGVYISEANSFPNSFVAVATAVPAFIGYTPQIEYRGKSLVKKAMRISSMQDFIQIFGLANLPAPAEPAKQYHPQYYLVEQQTKLLSGKSITIKGKNYQLLPDPSTIYYLYNSIQLFYQNGGGDAYIVSVGSYGAQSGKPVDNVDDHIINANVLLKDLQAGLEVLKNEQEPTLYICPEATLLSAENNATLMQSMLLQAQEMRTAMCLFDIIGGRNPHPVNYSGDIQEFRNGTGSVGLKFGAAYYPFVGTTIMQSTDIDFTNLLGGNIKSLANIINPAPSPNNAITKIINNFINSLTNTLTINQTNIELISVSAEYSLIIQSMLNQINILPTTSAIAGVITMQDSAIGVWKAPANVSMAGVSRLPFNLTSDQQGDLNVDVVSGKSINAIRSFAGRGVLIWGARTLAGNDLDWRYISVRRTMTMLEQTIKQGIRSFVFAANDANTWTTINTLIEDFLNSIWKQGGLVGSTPKDAFNISIGLGSSMTSDDISNGILRVVIAVSLVRPAEFIVMSIEQKMAK